MTSETHGSTRKNPHTAPQSASGISRATVKKPPSRVLVVDDEPLIRWSVTETLARLGFAVEQASDARSALRELTAGGGDFDVVLLDLRLPDMNDLSLLATIRQLQPAAAVILMTAFGTDDVLEHAIALGATTVLDKPFELKELTEAVCGAAA